MASVVRSSTGREDEKKIHILDYVDGKTTLVFSRSRKLSTAFEEKGSVQKNVRLLDGSLVRPDQYRGGGGL